MKGDWERYGRALHRAIAEVLEELRPHAPETADSWISVGLTIGLERSQARRLLELIEAEEAERAALMDDAAAFLAEALGETARPRLSVVASGTPHRIARRTKNKIVGRALARGGFRRLLWGR
jgi:beta-phosphoglucomutase-like phosphatase (HAD superfamily)